jgi:ribonuclease D
LSNVDYIYVRDAEQLGRVVRACLDVSVIALDTEFARFNTYYPIVGLVQIYTGSECFMIDPLEVEDLTPLIEVLESPGLLKVLHACSEDMEVFQHALGTIPSPVFDTQIASAALGVGFSVSYQALVAHYLDISLEKDQTRSDWLARPLSSEQLDYAALDVIHLLQVYEKQVELLKDTPKFEWVQAESLELGKDIPTMIAPEDFYLKLKGLWQFDRKQLNALRALCAWRETKARKENVPRNRIVDQKALMAIVRQNLNSRQAFQAEESITPRQVRKYGDDLIFMLSEASQVPEKDCPALVVRTDAPVNNKKLKRLREVVEFIATRLSVAPELLTKRRHLEKLIRSQDDKGHYHLPEELLGWRESVIGDELVKALQDY